MGHTYIKKHCFVITSALVLILLLVYIACFLVGSTAATFALHDQLGSREALTDLQVEGWVYDTYHRLNFILDNGTITTNLLFPNKSSIGMSAEEKAILNRLTYLMLDGRIPKSADTSISTTERDFQEAYPGSPPMIERTETILSDSVSFICTLRDLSRNNFDRAAWFKTDFTIQSDQKAFRFERRYYLGDSSIINSSQPVFRNEFPEEVNARLITINGMHYVGFLTNKLCRGESGIYRIDAFGSVFDTTEKNGEITRLVTIPLQDGSVRVIGFEALQDKLILILLIDDALCIRSYDLRGQLLGELMPELPKFTGSPVRYHAFSKEDQMYLGIFYDHIAMDSAALISLKADPELQLTGLTESFAIGKGRQMIFLALEAVSQKLVAVTAAYHEDTKPEEQFLTAPQYYLTILDGESIIKEPIYQGEFITDIADDYKIFSGVQPVYDTYSRYVRRDMSITRIK